ncbi:hypothetical protein Tco_0759813 [Tanacetum coccineum]
MSAITDVKCILTQKALDAFCNKFHIPEEVHPVLPNRNETMHERPARKIGLYTRFLTLPTLDCPCPPSLLSKRSDNASVCYTKPIDSLKNWNDHFFWVDDFAFPASFLWHTAKHKFPEAFMCLVGLSFHYTLDEETYPRFLHKNGEEMDIFAFIHTPDPTKVKIVERERNEGEPLLLETTIGRTVPLLPVAPDRAKCELDASVERIFDEGGSGNQTEQGNSAGGGKDADIQPIIEAADTVVEDVAPMQPKRQGKIKSMVMDVGEASHPPKKLREDHGTPSGTSVGGKSMSVVKRLLVGVVLNAKVGVAAIPILPFITASISIMPECEGRDHIDSVAGLNLRAIGAPLRFVISSDSSHHSGTNVAEAVVNSLVRSFVPIMTTVTTITSTVDPALVAKEKLVKPSLFCIGSSLAGGTDPTMGGFLDLIVSDFLVGAIHTVIDPDTDLQKIYVPQWSMTNRSRLNDGRVCHEMVDEFSPCNAEVRMRVEYNVKEKMRLKSVVERQVELLKVMEGEIENLKAQLLLSETEAAEAICLCAQAFNFEVIEKSLRDETNALKERNAILEKERNALDVKVTELEASVAGKECELTDLNALITSVKSQNDNLVDRVRELEISSSGLQKKVTVYENCMDQLEKFQDDRMKVVNDKFDKLWLLTHGMELAIVKCLNSHEYLSALGAAIGKAIEKGMQDGLSARISHGKEGRVLTDVAAHNPTAEVDYTSALQQL